MYGGEFFILPQSVFVFYIAFFNFIVKILFRAKKGKACHAPTALTFAGIGAGLFLIQVFVPLA